MRDALLDSGFVTDHRTGASLPEIANSETTDPDLPERGVARWHSNRLVVLDSRWFGLNGGDSEARAAIRAAFGLGDDRLAVSWASSTVFACINTQRRSHARGIASDFLAAKRVSQLDAVRTNEEHAASAADTLRDAESRLEKAVRDAYQHIVYLADDGAGGRTERYLRFQDDNQSALSGSVVWAALDDADKAFGQGVFDATALLHNLRAQDWGLPLTELRDMFWNTPRVPLLPGGDSDLRRALYGAITAGDIEIVDSAGETRAVATAGDINLTSSELRIARPSRGQVEVPSLIGQTAADARSALEQAGLTATIAIAGPAGGSGGSVALAGSVAAGGPVGPAGSVAGSAGPTGLVAEQDPTPGTTVDPGTTITLTLRNAIWRLLTTIAEAIDTNASHIQMTIQLTTPTNTKEKLTEAAKDAGVLPSVRDL